LAAESEGEPLRHLIMVSKRFLNGMSVAALAIF